MNKLISIIIPTYNRAYLIGETLDSIIAQTYTNWECIIIDDGSTDETQIVINQYLNKDQRFQYFHRPQNRVKGPNSCRNYGFEKSKGEYIYWFDSDDLLIDNSIETRIINFDEETDVVISKADFFDSETGVILSTNKIISNSVIEDYFVGIITYYVSGPIWKKTFLEKRLELFDENIRYLDDWDFNLRMIYDKPNIKIIDASLFKYRSAPYSLSKQINYLDINELKSEYQARNKHMKILFQNKILNEKMQIFILSRYKNIFRDGMIERHKKRSYFFKELILLQFKFKDYRGMLRTILGFSVYGVLNKGYFLMK